MRTFFCCEAVGPLRGISVMDDQGDAQPVAVAVVQHGGQFLVGRRPAGVALAGRSEFPGGKVRGRESASAAAIRECREETGLGVDVVRRIISVEHRYPHGRVRLDFFLCRPRDATVPPRPPFRWVEAAALADCDFPEANRDVIRQLARDTP